MCGEKGSFGVKCSKYRCLNKKEPTIDYVEWLHCKYTEFCFLFRICKQVKGEGRCVKVRKKIIYYYEEEDEDVDDDDSYGMHCKHKYLYPKTP
jgi:hypothetical protein